MSIYDYEVKNADGETVSLSDYKGKVLLIVNTASHCRFTPQFQDLQKLYAKYQKYGFEILGFPCNQFGEQEPGSNQDAVAFCQRNYGVTFPIFEKIEVNGNNAHPLFQYLKKEAPFKGFDETSASGKILKLMIMEKNPEWLVGDEIKWNFTKFLINRDGKVIRRYEPTEEPIDFEKDIETLVTS
ncbi:MULTISPECIES: glutathione peroxidase [Parageobacillus]|jgi:glutathione peroxidase|uniref:Glutathione peroxidase n=2 Tax=Parageobacillus TaxID=1906945 RepID=A0AA89NNE4_9BACL|nr:MULTISPECIES: glutathione peroxidase [Parageobacillus]OQO98673.1 glutathione peroxidase [Geobacillus sp. 44C]MBB3868421.1 glutathione peroxidase [Parageobacillus toebii NBRC 107807]MED4990430.1 glutathione peroxidase [Parageobacillus toebii]OXB93983.1 glutathione peroxidase [Parageobacillus galactosidasius]QNU33554.1 glutathione peroxidase [Geobacillus sp. 44C]